MDTESDIISEIRGKVAKYNILKQLYREKKEDYNRRASELREHEDQLKQVTTEYQLLCSELDNMKVRVPAQYTALFEGVEPFIDVPLQAFEPEMSSESNRSLTEMILDAARQAKKLEDNRDLMRLMLKDKEKQVEKLSKQFNDNEVNFKHMQQHAESLSLQVAELKEQLSRQQQQQLDESSMQDTTWIVGDGSHLDDVTTTTMDPAVLKCRIKELEQRIAELMSHNAKWKEICESLKQEAEAANIKLRQLENSLSATQLERDDAVAQVKREQESKLKTEELCRQLSSDVRRLEAQVHDLEEQLENLEWQQSLAVQQYGDLLNKPAAAAAAEGLNAGVVSELSDEIAALKLQSEDYKETLEAEMKEHALTKAQNKSLNQQWRTIYEELRSKQLQLQEATAKSEKLAAMNMKLEQLLKEARVDQSLIERHLSEIAHIRTPPPTTTTTTAAAAADKYSTAVATSDSSSYKKQPQKVIDTKVPRRGVLEEDDAVIYKHCETYDAVEQQKQQQRHGPTNPTDCSFPHRWICRRCTFVNDNPRYVTSCEICETERTGLVTQASDDVINEAKQTMNCDRKHFSPAKQSMFGHVTAPSRLEEDGIVTSSQSLWLYI